MQPLLSQVVRVLRLVPDIRQHGSQHLLPLGVRHHVRQREDHQVADVADDIIHLLSASHATDQGEASAARLLGADTQLENQLSSSCRIVVVLKS